VTKPVFVIVGGGPCAASAAATLRSAGFDGRVVIVGDEPVPPYQRPPLSKDYLTGQLDVGELPVRRASWYAEHEVELRLGERAERIDDRERVVRLGGGERLGYDALLLATGGRPRPFGGLQGSAASERVAYLRTRSDADWLGARLRQGEPLVVLGGGFIGCEVAASARRLGVEVTVLEMARVPLERALGAEVGSQLAEIHRDAGVDFRTGEQVRSVFETADGLVVTTERSRLECGLLLAAVGMVPNTEIVAGTSVKCENGIVVDEHCRTAVPGIYAAGDVAAHYHPMYGRHLRVEHHDNAIKHGAVAARNMLGEDVAYDDPHWFWSDQYEHSLQSVGFDEGCDQVVVRGSIAERSFARFALADGRVRAVVALDRSRDIIAARKLIAAGVQVSAAALSDESVDLRRLARAAGR
jgi:3-phenylpropionate/trans-cinnamate dioxygenase ferredoxin reductase subunit